MVQKSRKKKHREIEKQDLHNLTALSDHSTFSEGLKKKKK